MIYKRWRNRIRPVYAQPNQDNLGIANLLIQLFKSHIGKKKRELNEAVEGMEDLGYDYRYVRGLATLLQRRYQLETGTTTNPVQVRRHVFSITNARGVPTTQEERETILRQSASKLRISVEDLERSLYADLEEELKLKSFETIDPEALVKQYNLSLTQTLLFYSTELQFTAQRNWQRIFRQIKWLGLIYVISRRGDTFQVRVDGPISLFRLNRRYGTRLAKLLPTIIQSQEWSVEAKILSPKGERRLLSLELDSQKHGSYLTTSELVGDKAYDSQVEQNFAQRFNALDTGWNLIREPEIIPVGRQVMIPDFTIQKADMKVYLEVMGFWTPQYLQEKVKKLKVLEVDMIVAADTALACQKLDRIKDRLEVVYYQRKIPLKPILAHLEAKEERAVKEQLRCLRIEELNIQEPVVEAKELAKRMGVLKSAVMTAIRKKSLPGYIRLGDMLIKDSKLMEIQEKLKERKGAGELTLGEASKIIEELGGRKPTTILEALGYSIEWRGIDPQSAKLHKRNIEHQKSQGE